MSEHWEHIYSTKSLHEVSWTRPHLDSSLKIIDSLGLSKDSPIIDVGSGASTLPDDLVERGFTDITLVDISAAALEHTRERLGPAAGRIRFIPTDITTLEIESDSYELWHDRAVFHFLTSEALRKKYLDRLTGALRAGGDLIMATFADDGPLKCSGLDVCRYDIELLAATLGSKFELVETFREQHQTPFDTTQNFLYGHFRKQL